MTVVERNHCATTTRRKARKLHVCCACEKYVRPGEVYLSHKGFPGHDALSVTVPRTMAECRACAERYGRGHLFEATS